MKNSFLKNTLACLFVIVIGAFLVEQKSASAQTIIVEEKKAQATSTSIWLTEGRTARISFKNDEIITFVLLSDQSKNVYTLNAEIETGQAKSIFLRQIEPLKILGITTADVPNLSVVTTNSKGEQNEYEFDINNNSDQPISSIIIENSPPKIVPKVVSLPKNTIQTSLGEAKPEDIELGLQVSLRKGLLAPDDPLIFAVSEYVALVQNGLSSDRATEKVGLPLSVLQKLGLTGQKEDARRRILPLSPTLAPIKIINPKHNLQS